MSATERWEFFRSTIVDLYCNGRSSENKPYTLSDVILIMKRDHGFDGGERQYKYHLKKWNAKKNSDSKGKAGRVCKIYQSRSVLGKSTKIRLRGTITIDKLQRQIKAQAKEELALVTRTNGFVTDLQFLQPVLQASRSILLNWNLPHRPTRMVKLPQTQGEPPAPTPSDMSVDTPSVAAALTPMSAPSPFTAVIQRKTAVERGRLFVEGRHAELIQSMNGKERLATSQWFYRFWIFAFMTSKYWGRGPREWDARMLQFEKYEGRGIAPSPNTPGHDVGTPGSVSTPGGMYMGDLDGFELADTPSDLCRWSIHIRNEDFERDARPDNNDDDEMDVDGVQLRQRWRKRGKHACFEKKMRVALESNHFSSIADDKLPVGIPQVLRAAAGRKDELLLEALGFSIMGRNVRLLMRTMAKVHQKKLNVTEIYPFHLATSYLDGSGTCCNVLNELCFFTGELSLRRLYRDNRGYTVLDNLMVTIIKAHTSCRPGEVDSKLKHQTRFPGEEVDVCGRWDADSDCVRLLLSNGRTAIPFAWKHKFCHTSAQAICHCITTIFGPYGAPDIAARSGLFQHDCHRCGLRMELLPLHTLVVVATLLARRGCDGEDLFGTLAVLLCLLKSGADPTEKTSVSVEALLSDKVEVTSNDMDLDFCEHVELDAYELANAVLEPIILTWPIERRNGWHLFCHVLRLSRDGRLADEGEEVGTSSASTHKGKNRASTQVYCESCEFEEKPNPFRGGRQLGVLWAAVQTELLTYRRVEDEDPWTSDRFNMRRLLRSLGPELSLEQSLQVGIDHLGWPYRLTEEVGTIDNDLVKEGMMKPHCECGSFVEACDDRCVGMEEVSAHYFANLESWDRTKFIHFPEREWLEEVYDKDPDADRDTATQEVAVEYRSIEEDDEADSEGLEDSEDDGDYDSDYDD